MANSIEYKDDNSNLAVAQRVTRATVAIVMLLYPLTVVDSHLGLLALLPLLAIYPMFTAIVGWDPVEYAFNSTSVSLRARRRLARSGLVVVGGSLIAITLLTNTTPLGGLVVLALIAIIPFFVAIIGENPVNALIESCKSSNRFSQSVDQTQISRGSGVVHYINSIVKNADCSTNSGNEKAA